MLVFMVYGWHQFLYRWGQCCDRRSHSYRNVIEMFNCRITLQSHYGKQWLEAQAKLMPPCELNLWSPYLWDGCFEDSDPVCDHSHSAAIYKTTLQHQDRLCCYQSAEFCHWIESSWQLRIISFVIFQQLTVINLPKLQICCSLHT